LATSLAGRFRILAPDLPGHGRSSALPPGGAGLDAIAAALGVLVRDLGEPPDLIVGHSAGAAIAARMALDAGPGDAAVLSINGALRPLRGWSAATFVPLARLLGTRPIVARLVARVAAADTRAVRRLLDSTGSKIDAGMLGLYSSLLRSPAHVGGTLRMLSEWTLKDLARQLPRLGPRLTLVAGAADRTISPQDAQAVQEQVPGSRLLRLPAIGHLAHEEAPDVLARIVVALARGRGRLGAAELVRETGT